MTKTSGLSKNFFVQCFINSCKEAIKNQVTLFQPITLTQTIELVLLQNWIIEVILKEFKDSNESGESRMNFTRIIITNYHPLRRF